MTDKLSKSFSYKALQTVGFTLYSLLLIPLLIRYWDTATYGSWIAIYALYNLIQVIEFGHNTYVGNAFNSLVNTDKLAAKRILGSAFKVNVLAGVLQMLVIWVIYSIGAFGFFIKTDLPDKDIATILTLLFLYRILIGAYRGLLIKILNPFGYIYKSYQFSLVERLIEFIVLTSAAFSGISLIDLAWIWFIVKSLYSIGIMIYIKKLLPEYFPWWSYGNLSLGLKNFVKSSAYMVSTFLNRFVSDGVLLIISPLLGTEFLPVFVATRSIVNFSVKVGDVILSPLGPELINHYANKFYDKLMRIFSYYWSFTGTLLVLGFALSIFFIEPIFEIWTGGKLKFRPILFFGLVVAALLRNYGAILYTFLMGINKARVVVITTLLRALILVLGIFLLYPYGVKGLVISFIATEFITSILWLPICYVKSMDQPVNNASFFWVNPLVAALLGFFLYLDQINASWFWLVLVLLSLIVLLFWQFKRIEKTAKTRLSSLLQRIQKLS